MARQQTTRAFAVLPLVAGLWLLMAPFALGYAGLTQALWNDTTVGVLLLLLSLPRFFMPRAHPAWNWILIALGVWLVLAPFVLGYGNFGNPGDSVNTGGATWNDIILGPIVIAIAAEDAAVSGARRRRARGRHDG